MASSLLTRGRHYRARIPEERTYSTARAVSIGFATGFATQTQMTPLYEKDETLVLLPEMADSTNGNEEE
jgi:hypothetical protein